VEACGAALLLGSVGIFIAGGVCAVLGQTPPGVLGIPIGVSGLLGVPTGWRLLMRPEDPRSPVAGAVVERLTGERRR
jgi:hypothetical protein